MTTLETKPKKSRRRWLRFSLRTLMLMMLVVSMGMSWLAGKLQAVKRQREAVAAIQALGGTCWFDDEHLRIGCFGILPRAKPGPACLRKLLGDDFFTNVTYVNFHGDVSEATLKQVEQFPHLREISCGSWPSTDRIHVSEAGLRYLRGLTELKGLSFPNTNLNDRGLEHLKGLVHLRRMNLRGSEITGQGLRHLDNAVELEDLDLNCTKIDDVGLQHLRRLTKLSTLDLGQTNVTDEGLRNIQRLQKLKLLTLDGTRVGGPGLAYIAEMKQLVWLWLGDTPVDDQALEHLKGMTGLKLLALTGTRVTEVGVAMLQDALPNCLIAHDYGFCSLHPSPTIVAFRSAKGWRTDAFRGANGDDGIMIQKNGRSPDARRPVAPRPTSIS